MISKSNVGILLCLLSLHHVNAFPMSSSQSSSKKNISNQKPKKAIQGFGKKSTKETIHHTVDTSETTSELIKFLTAQNTIGLSGEDKGCEIGISNTGRRGIYTTRPYRKNDIICRIPSDCILALSNPDLGGDDTPTLAHCGRNFLDMYQNHPEGSKTWKAYLDTLPSLQETFDATPDFFTDEEIEAIEFPKMTDAVNKHLMEIAELCAASSDDGDGNDSIPFEDLQFATWLVSSRSIKISMEDNDASKEVPDGVIAPRSNKSIRVMTPFLDMINHSSDNSNAELHLIDPEKDEAWFTIKANRNIKEGREITMSYGSGVMSSVDLLRQYGFVPEENKFDKYMLKKGGEGCIESLDGWSTTLKEDEALLKDSGLTGNMRKVLQLRCQLKRSYS